MSMDEAGSGQPLETPESKRKSRAPKAKVRKHLITTAYKNDVAEKLDKLFVAGHTILTVIASSDFRGFEIVSYTEE